MALRLSTQSGNTHSAPFAFGTTVVDGDQLQVTSSAHAIHFDANCTIGVSRPTANQGRPSGSGTGSGGSLPAGNYRLRLAAVGATGSATPTTQSFTISLAAGELLRVTIPALVAASTGYDVYLSQAGGAVNTERLYALNKPPGTFDCASANWEDGTVPYASAALVTAVFGDAFSYPQTLTSHSGGITVAAGVVITCKGDFSILGDFQLNAGTVLEFDATDSPSGASIYRLFSGTPTATGSGKLIMRGTSGARAEVRSKAATTPAHIRQSSQGSVSSSWRTDLEWAKFKRLGDATNQAILMRCTVAYDQLWTDVLVDTDCYSVELVSAPATGGWNFTRVSFTQAQGQTYGSRSCALSLQPTDDATTGQRLCTNVAFTTIMPALAGGGTVMDHCYMPDGWANTPSSGGITIPYEIRHCFIRKTHPGSATGVDGFNLAGSSLDNYLYFDNITDPQTDLNPHGMQSPGPGLGNTRIHEGWTVEYNDASSSGDMFKSPTGKGVVRLLKALVIPNRIGESSGTLMTFPNNPDVDYDFELIHCTGMFGPYPMISTSEGGPQPAGTVNKCQSNLGFNIAGTTGNRFVMGKSSGDGENDTIDIAAAADVSHNAYWNAGTPYVGGTRPYNTRFSATPGLNDVDLGTSAGGDIAAVGPMFVDPSRKFLTWCEIVLGVTGTNAQKIQQGFDALIAIADTTSPNYVSGLLMTDPATWVRAGFKPTNPLLFGVAHDGTTIGAIEGEDEPPPPPPPTGELLAMGGRFGIAQRVW